MWLTGLWQQGWVNFLTLKLNNNYNNNIIIHKMDHTSVPAMIDHSIRVSSFRILLKDGDFRLDHGRV